MVQCDAILLGMEGAGKSLLMRQLQRLSKQIAKPVEQDTVPTVGVELFDITVGTGWRKKQLRVREVGGCMVPVWRRYHDDCYMAVYVVDMADPERLPMAIGEFLSLMKQMTHSLAGEEKPICLVLNKMDLPITVPRLLLNTLFRLADIEAESAGRLTVLEVSALDATNADALLQWLIKNRW